MLKIINQGEKGFPGVQEPGFFRVGQAKQDQGIVLEFALDIIIMHTIHVDLPVIAFEFFPVRLIGKIDRHPDLNQVLVPVGIGINPLYHDPAALLFQLIKNQSVSPEIKQVDGKQ